MVPAKSGVDTRHWAVFLFKISLCFTVPLSFQPVAKPQK